MPQRSAFVEMSKMSEADQAIAALNGADVNGRTLNVNEARPKTSGGTGRGNSGGYGRTPPPSLVFLPVFLKISISVPLPLLHPGVPLGSGAFAGTAKN